MGALGFGHLVLALLVPPACCLLVWAVLRKRAMAQPIRPHLPILFLLVCSFGSSSLLAILVKRDMLIAGFFGPSSAAAVGPETELTNADMFRRSRIYVYPLEAWGEQAKRYEVGDIIGRTILETLRDEDLLAAKGDEGMLPLDIFQTDNLDASILPQYKKIVPFTSVFGHVGVHPDGRFEVGLYVHSVDRTLRPKLLLERELFVLNSPSTIDAAARQLAEEVLEALSDDVE